MSTKHPTLVPEARALRVFSETRTERIRGVAYPLEQLKQRVSS